MKQDSSKTYPIVLLNRSYYACAHQSERLSEIESHPYFASLRRAIKATGRISERQLRRMEKLFTLLGIAPSFDSCKSTITSLEEAFNDIPRDTGPVLLRNLALLFYLEQVSAIQIASLEIITLTPSDALSAPLKRLIQKVADQVKLPSPLKRMLTAPLAATGSKAF